MRLYFLWRLVLVLSVLALTPCCDRSAEPEQEPASSPVVEPVQPEIMPPTTADPPPDLPPQPQSGPIKLVDTNSGRASAFKSPVKKVIRSQVELDRLNVADVAEVNVDFNEHHLILLAMGEQFGDFRIRIDSVNREGQYLIVRAVGESLPGKPEGELEAVADYPYCTAIIPRTGATEVISELFLE